MTIKTIKKVVENKQSLFFGTNQAHVDMHEREVVGLLVGQFTDNPLEALIFAFGSANRHYPGNVWHPPMSIVVLRNYDERLVNKISTQGARGLGNDGSTYFGVKSIRGVMKSMHLEHYPENCLDLFVEKYCENDERSKEILEGIKRQISKKRTEDLIHYGMQGSPLTN